LGIRALLGREAGLDVGNYRRRFIKPTITTTLAIFPSGGGTVAQTDLTAPVL